MHLALKRLYSSNITVVVYDCILLLPVAKSCIPEAANCSILYILFSYVRSALFYKVQNH